MRSTIPALALGCVAACSAPVIEMKLALPDPVATAAFDLSCAGAVRITAIGKMPDSGRQAEADTQCLDFGGPIHSFDDVANALRGKFTFDIPSDGLAGVQLTGFSGRCSEPSTMFESVFYGGAPSVDDGTLVVPVYPGVACGTGQSYNVRVLDLTALYASAPSNVTCARPPDPVQLFTGVIRPRLLGPTEPQAVFEYGADAVNTSDGLGKLQSFRPTDGGPACIALGYTGASSKGLTCVRPAAQARGLCGEVNDVEIVAAPITDNVTSVDPTLLVAYGPPVFGAVWEAGTRTPIANATVELADPAQGTVVYIDLGIDAGVSPPRLRRMAQIAGAASTTAGGGFIAYVRGTATNLIVKAPDHVTQTLRIASTPDQISTMIVALTRQ